MRLQDRAIADLERVWDVLRSAEVCRVAFCNEDWPYIVPMNFGILDERLYFHCAATGTKLDLLEANPNVCFEVEANIKIIPGDKACGWSVRYQSVIGFGRASVVEDPDEKRAGIRALLSQYTEGALAQYTDRELEIPQSISSDTVILRIDIHSLEGKESTGD